MGSRCYRVAPTPSPIAKVEVSRLFSRRSPVHEGQDPLLNTNKVNVREEVIFRNVDCLMIN